MVFTILCNRYSRSGDVFYAASGRVRSASEMFLRHSDPKYRCWRDRCDIHDLCTLIKGFCGVGAFEGK